MRPSTEYLKVRERFLTPELFSRWPEYGQTNTDYFTMSDDFPKTFRIAECRSITADRVDLIVQLFWRDDDKNVQRHVIAGMVNQRDRWLIDSVGVKK